MNSRNIKHRDQQRAALEEFDLAIALGLPVPSIAMLLREALEHADVGIFTLVMLANRCPHARRLLTVETVRAWPEEELPLFAKLIFAMEYRRPALYGPCGPRERFIARVLTDRTLPRSLRAKFWWEVATGAFAFPCRAKGERGSVPDALMDIPAARTWHSSWERRKFFEDAPARASWRFKGNSLSVENKAWKAIDEDSPCEFFMIFDLLGKKVPRTVLQSAFFREAVEIILEWIHSPRYSAFKPSPRDVLLEACSNWAPSSALRLARQLEEDSPGLIASSKDDFGNDALWNSLHSRQRFHLENLCEDGARPSLPLSRFTPLEEFLQEKGCNPDRDGQLGLSWRDVYASCPFQMDEDD